MTPRFCYWATAPNRHLEPFLDEAFRIGALQKVVYLDPHLPTSKQLGTRPPRRDPDLELYLGTDPDWHVKALSVLRGGYDFHVIYGIGARLSQFAMNTYFMTTCANEGIPYFFVGESLFVRGPLDPRRFARELLYRHVCRRAAGVFAVGRRAALDFERLGVPATKICPAAYCGPPPLARARMPVRSAELVFCGRLIELKGLDDLADALAAMPSRADLGITTIGDGPYDAPLRRIAAAGVPVTAWGAVASERVGEIMQGAAALVLPTRHREGWGYVVNEAISAGLPVVVSDVVGAREILVSGRNGEVFPNQDSAALAQAIEAVLRLARDPERLRGSLAVTREGLEPARYTAWFLDTARAMLAGSPAPWPPWLAAAERLGGNAETRWWRSRLAWDRAA